MLLPLIRSLLVIFSDWSDFFMAELWRIWNRRTIGLLKTTLNDITCLLALFSSINPIQPSNKKVIAPPQIYNFEIKGAIFCSGALIQMSLSIDAVSSYVLQSNQNYFFRLFHPYISPLKSHTEFPIELLLGAWKKTC